MVEMNHFNKVTCIIIKFKSMKRKKSFQSVFFLFKVYLVSIQHFIDKRSIAYAINEIKFVGSTLIKETTV